MAIGIGPVEVIILVVIGVGLFFLVRFWMRKEKAASPGTEKTPQVRSGNVSARSFSILGETSQGEHETVISTEDVPLDNRHGSSPISSQHEFSQTAKVSVSISKEKGLEAGMSGEIWSLIEANLSGNIAETIGIQIGQEITRRVTVKFEALPGKFVRYRVVWKQNVKEGLFDVTVGAKTIRVPYKAVYGLFHSIESIEVH
jgi:hypothetical protein